MPNSLPVPVAPNVQAKPAGRLTPRRRKLYLAALARGDSVSAACKAAGVAYRAIQWARSRGQLDFEEETSCYAEGTSALEQEAVVRGRDGVEDVQLYQGQVVYHQELRHEVDTETGQLVQVFKLKLDEDGQPIPIVKRQYSDNLLQFVMRARDPARYASQRVEHTGEGGGPVEHRVEVYFVE